MEDIDELTRTDVNVSKAVALWRRILNTKVTRTCNRISIASAIGVTDAEEGRLNSYLCRLRQPEYKDKRLNRNRLMCKDNAGNSVLRLGYLLPRAIKVINDHGPALRDLLARHATSTPAAAAATGTSPTKQAVKREMKELARENERQGAKMRRLTRQHRMAQNITEREIEDAVDERTRKAEAEAAEQAAAKDDLAMLNSDLMEDIETRDLELSEARALHTALKEKIKKLEQKQEIAEWQLKTARRERDKARGELAEFRNSEPGEALRRSRHATGETNRRRSVSHQNAMKVVTLGNANGKLRGQLEDAQSRCTELESKAKNRAAKAGDYNQEVHQEHARNAELREELAKAKKDIAGAEGALRVVQAFTRYDANEHEIPFAARRLIIRLLALGLAPAKIPGVIVCALDTDQIILPTVRHIRRMRGEMRVVVELMAVYAAADRTAKWECFHTDGTDKSGLSFVTAALQFTRASGDTVCIALRPAFLTIGKTAEQETEAVMRNCIGYGKKILRVWKETATAMNLPQGACARALCMGVLLRSMRAGSKGLWWFARVRAPRCLVVVPAPAAPHVPLTFDIVVLFGCVTDLINEIPNPDDYGLDRLSNGGAFMTDGCAQALKMARELVKEVEKAVCQRAGTPPRRRIRVTGYGWKELKCAFSEGGVARTLEELRDHLVSEIFTHESKNEKPEAAADALSSHDLRASQLAAASLGTITEQKVRIIQAEHEQENELAEAEVEKQQAEEEAEHERRVDTFALGQPEFSEVHFGQNLVGVAVEVLYLLEEANEDNEELQVYKQWLPGVITKFQDGTTTHKRKFTTRNGTTIERRVAMNWAFVEFEDGDSEWLRFGSKEVFNKTSQKLAWRFDLDCEDRPFTLSVVAQPPPSSSSAPAAPHAHAPALSSASPPPPRRRPQRHLGSCQGSTGTMDGDLDDDSDEEDEEEDDDSEGASDSEFEGG